MARLLPPPCVLLLVLIQAEAHYIQIDHEEFRATGFPHPHFPPPPLTPLEHLPPQVLATKELTPAEVMVDLTNDLTHRLLHYHSILNRNNFAFSPTALVSVLVALYEGSAGNSAGELRNVLQLPNNRDVTRVGYRDIHRRLRVSRKGAPQKWANVTAMNLTHSQREASTLDKPIETHIYMAGWAERGVRSAEWPGQVVIDKEQRLKQRENACTAKPKAAPGP